VASTPDGHGYWLVGSDGGVFAYGDAKFFGSTGSTSSAQPVSGLIANADSGYRTVQPTGGTSGFGTL
jgi:hypothetical protein